MPHLTVRLYDNELARVKAAAVLRKVPVSELVRDALEAKAAAVLDGAAKPKAAPAPAPVVQASPPEPAPIPPPIELDFAPSGTAASTASALPRPSRPPTRRS